VPPGTAPNRIADALQRYESARARDEAELGVIEAAQLHNRLFDDLELQAAPPPDGYSAADWADTVASTLSLDVQAVDQLVANRARQLQATGKRAVRGAASLSSAVSGWDSGYTNTIMVLLAIILLSDT
jgi:hypothetical protein